MNPALAHAQVWIPMLSYLAMWVWTAILARRAFYLEGRKDGNSHYDNSNYERRNSPHGDDTWCGIAVGMIWPVAWIVWLFSWLGEHKRNRWYTKKQAIAVRENAAKQERIERAKEQAEINRLVVAINRDVDAWYEAQKRGV